MIPAITKCPYRTRCLIVTSNRDAFALLEVVVTMLLTVLLMTTVIHIMRSVEQSLAAFSRLDDLPTDAVAQQLQRDILNATQYRVYEDRFELLGIGAQAPADGGCMLRPAWISYRSLPSPLGPVLTRYQQLLDVDLIASQPARSSDPIWLGVSAVRITTSYIDFAEQVELSVGEIEMQARAGGGGWMPVPPVVELQLLGDNGRCILRETILRVGR